MVKMTLSNSEGVDIVTAIKELLLSRKIYAPVELRLPFASGDRCYVLQYVDDGSGNLVAHMVEVPCQ